MKKELKKIIFVVGLPIVIPILFTAGFLTLLAIGVPKIFKALGEIIKEELNK